MIEEPPYRQSRSRIHDQKITSSPRLANSSNSKSKQFKNSDSDLPKNDLEFIEQIDLEKIASLLLNDEKDLSDDGEYYEYNNNKAKAKEKMKKIIQKFIKMKSFPVGQPQLITKLLQTLQVFFRFLSNSIFQEKELKNSAQNNGKFQTTSDVKMIIGIQCPVCQKLFRSTYFLDKHMLKKHPQHSSLWQNFKSPIVYHSFNKAPSPDNFSKKSEEIERALKKIHKDLKNGQRNSSVSIESRISNVETTMQDLGLISLPTQEGRHRSRRNSSNSMVSSPLSYSDRQNENNKIERKNNNSNDSRNNNLRKKDSQKHNDHSSSNDGSDNGQDLKSARVRQVSSTPRMAVNDNPPNSARVHSYSSIPQSQSAKIPKLPGKPFIPDLHLQTLKPQESQQVQSQPAQSQQVQQQQYKLEINENIDDDVSAEARKKPQSSKPGGMKRPIPRKKPNSINVPSLQLDFDDSKSMTQTIGNTGNFYSPRLPENNGLAFTNSYRTPQSARSNSHSGFNNIVSLPMNESNDKPTNTNYSPKKPLDSTPHSKRVIPFPQSSPNTKKMPPTPTKIEFTPSKAFSPPASPFAFIQTRSDDDDDESDEVHITTTGNSVQQEQESSIDLANENSIPEKNEVKSENPSVQETEEKIEKSANNPIIPTPISIGISKKTNVLNNFDDDVPEEYFDSVSSISSESSELPEVDFKPKPKQQETKESKDRSSRRRHKKKPNDNT